MEPCYNPDTIGIDDTLKHNPDIDTEYAPEIFAADMGLTFANKLNKSELIEVRAAGARLVESGPLKGNETKKHTAEGRANVIQRQQSTSLYKGLLPHYNEWAVEKGYGVLSREFGSIAGKQFREEVGNALSGATDVSKQALAAVPAARKVLDDQLQLLKDAGVKGFDDVDLKDNYLPRFHNHGRFLDTVADIGEDGLAKFFANAMRATGRIPEDVVEQVSQGYVRRVIDLASENDVSMVHGISETNIEELRRWLPDADTADTVIASLKRFNQSKLDEQGTLSHAKRRTPFDDTYSESINGRHIRMSDLFERDAGNVIDRYIRTTSGAIGLAKEAGLKSQADIDKLLASVRTKGSTLGAKGSKKAGQDAETLDQAIRLIQGSTLDRDPYSTATQAGRLVRGYNFSRMMGQVGFAQIGEMGNVIGAAGLKNLLTHMPEMARMMRRARSGKIEDDFADELEFLIGPGTDYIRHPVRSAFDDHGLGFDTSTTARRAMKAISGGVDGAKKFTSVVSGMTPVTALLQRWSAKSIAQKWANNATGSVTFNSAQNLRMRDAGLTEESLEAINEQIRKHASMNSRGKVLKLNHEQWDTAALDEFRMALNRVNRRVVQENDIGASHPFMHKEIGKIMFEFRSFMINAWTKQTMYGLRYRDAEAFTSFAMGMTFASLAYMTQNSLNFAGDPAELRKRLELKNIAASAFQRTAQASMIPAVADTALSMAGFKPFFAFGRSSGQATSLITGNPTFTLASDVSQLASLPGSLLHDDYRFSQEDMRRVTRSLAFQNLLGVKNIISAMNDGLPPRSQEDDYWN